MSTLATLRTELAEAIRDPSNLTFGTDALNSLLNQGLAKLSRFHPREAVDTSVTLTVAVNSYTTSVSFTNIYRVDRYNAAGTYQETLVANTGDGPNSGWEWHNSVLYLTPYRTWTTGDTLHIFGYAGYAAMTTDDDEPPIDIAGEWALITFGQMEAYGRLAHDRAAFQQWQANPGNTDVTELTLGSMYRIAQDRWEEEKRDLRRMRKVG